MKRLNKRGFTLIETVFSILIFGIIMLALANMFSVIINTYTASKNQFKATLLAQSYFEEIKATPIEDVRYIEYVLGDDTWETDFYSESYRVVIKISKITEYDGRLIKIVIEVAKDGKVLEKLEGCKLI